MTKPTGTWVIRRTDSRNGSVTYFGGVLRVRGEPFGLAWDPDLSGAERYATKREAETAARQWLSDRRAEVVKV